MRDRVRALEMANETYEHRIENERKHLTDQRKALQEKYDQEVKARKELEEKTKVLEERLKALDTRHWRQRSQNRGRGRGQGPFHPNSRDAAPVRSNNNSNYNNETQVTAFRVEMGRPNVILPRRPSLLPRPSRPSTPIRSPITREPGSNSSTLTSSMSSTFTQRSQNSNESFSSTETFSAGSGSPNSPRTMRPPSPRDLLAPLPLPSFQHANTTIEIGRRPAVRANERSWANIARSGSNI